MERSRSRQRLRSSSWLASLLMRPSSAESDTAVSRGTVIGMKMPCRCGAVRVAAPVVGRWV